MRELLKILREHDLRIVVLAVVLGEAIATAISAFIRIIGFAVTIGFQGGELGNNFQYAARANLLTALTSIILWLVVAYVTLRLIQRLLPRERE